MTDDIPQSRVCKKCGVCQAMSEFYRDKRYPNSYSWECRVCKNKRVSLYEKTKGREKVRIKDRKRAAARYAADPQLFLKRLRQYRKNSAKRMSDFYIKRLLTWGTSCPRRIVPKELVEAKRLQLSIKRHLKGETHGER